MILFTLARSSQVLALSLSLSHSFAALTLSLLSFFLTLAIGSLFLSHSHFRYFPCAVQTLILNWRAKTARTGRQACDVKWCNMLKEDTHQKLNTTALHHLLVSGPGIEIEEMFINSKKNIEIFKNIEWKVKKINEQQQINSINSIKWNPIKGTNNVCVGFLLCIQFKCASKPYWLSCTLYFRCICWFFFLYVYTRAVFRCCLHNIFYYRFAFISGCTVRCAWKLCAGWLYFNVILCHCSYILQ